MLDILKKINRTVLEIDIGIVFCGILLQAAALPFARDRMNWCLSLLIGSLLALLGIGHMYRTLDRALELGEDGAQKMIYRGYVVRYAVLVAVVALMTLTKWLNPLLLFLAYMSMKAAVYLQPITHKLCNRFFHETDPEPETVPDPEEDNPSKREVRQ